jgi:hypothetical protein
MAALKSIGWIWVLAILIPAGVSRGAPDIPFAQPVSHQYPLPPGFRGQSKRLCIDQDDIVYVLTAKGMLRLYEDKVAPDQSYRPLAGRIPKDITVANGKLYYLFENELVCNRDAGKFVHRIEGDFRQMAVNAREEVLLASESRIAVFKNGELTRVDWQSDSPIGKIYTDGNDFYIATGEGVYEYSSEGLEKTALNCDARALVVVDGELIAGTSEGLVSIHAPKLFDRLPSTKITALAKSGKTLWAGTKRGIWRRNSDEKFSYFAGRRWLNSDEVVDVQLDSQGNAWALTGSGLNEVEFRAMTLKEKAAWYEKKIRQRHIRYGLCAELHLKKPGDVTSEEMVDTDNDGTWSNYYMASEAFRFGATGDEQARAHAWETFTALERLESINPLRGFPARSFERKGFKVSDPERWHEAEGGIWEWKSHTSSDEVIAHTFGSAVLYETTAKTKAEKERIAIFYSKILDHIIRNNWYLIDVDGKPTLWARWNPEYVNHFPESVFDRRLNSSEIIAMLEFGYKITGKEEYRAKAYELLEHSGYLKNILQPMSKIGDTPGIVHLGVRMGDDWNHSDDLLAFVCYWVLYHYAFTDELRAQYASAIRDHWNYEKIERCPLWNFIYASTGAKNYDREGALWTLRGFPLDMIDWSVSNSHRRDITPKAPNFRGQELEELLEPYERRITRWNSQPFILDGGNGGATELAGDEFLLPYWMGRYLKLID